MNVQWKDHTLEVTGSWSGRWLYLAPEYELWLDDQCLDVQGGPRIHPTLEAIYEDDDGELHHIEAELVSVIGYKPRCELSVEGDVLASETVRVQNFLNPFLVLSILVSTAIMLYVGPDVIEQFMPV